MVPIEFSYEEMIPNFRLSGNGALYEGAPPPTTTDLDLTQGARNIRVDQSWFVHLVWQTTGFLNYAIDGKWYIQVFLEKMGEEEFKLMEGPVPVEFESYPHTYHHDVAFGPNTVPEGLYKVSVAMTMKGPSNVPCPIAAVGEGPLIQFYKVGP